MWNSVPERSFSRIVVRTKNAENWISYQSDTFFLRVSWLFENFVQGEARKQVESGKSRTIFCRKQGLSKIVQKMTIKLENFDKISSLSEIEEF